MANQNKGSSQDCTMGTKNTPAMIRKITPKAGNVSRSRRRAGFSPWYNATSPAIAKITVGT